MSSLYSIGMFTLMVSYNCGISYEQDRVASYPDELLDRCRELDAQILRWYITNPDGEVCHDLPCFIHARTLGFMKGLA